MNPAAIYSNPPALAIRSGDILVVGWEECP
jgi:hypothetical protein